MKSFLICEKCKRGVDYIYYYGNSRLCCKCYCKMCDSELEYLRSKKL